MRDVTAPAPGRKKIQIDLDKEALDVIARLRKAEGATSMSEVLRSALGLLDWACDQVEAGYAVGAFKEGAPVKEVVVCRYAARRGAARRNRE